MKSIKEWRDILDGREYREELTYGECEELIKEGIVVAFGASDDLIIFSGVIDGEEGAYMGNRILFKNGDIFKDRCLDGCPYEQNIKQKCIDSGMFLDIESSNDGWNITTPIHHETFTIYDDGERYGNGVLFYKSSIVGN